MASHIVPHFLPSQQELEPAEIALDCLEKLKVLTLAVNGTDFFEQYADQLTIHQYLTLISDLTEIGYYHLDLSLKSSKDIRYFSSIN